jgi:hypothetical protein
VTWPREQEQTVRRRAAKTEPPLRAVAWKRARRIRVTRSVRERLVVVKVAAASRRCCGAPEPRRGGAPGPCFAGGGRANALP